MRLEARILVRRRDHSTVASLTANTGRNSAVKRLSERKTSIATSPATRDRRGREARRARKAHSERRLGKSIAADPPLKCMKGVRARTPPYGEALLRPCSIGKSSALGSPGAVAQASSTKVTIL